MNTLNRFKAPLALAFALALPVLSNGCSSVADAQAAVCCTEFKAGGTITASIGGSVESQIAAQAVADFSGIASAAVDDITTACRNIAQDLDADKAKQDAAAAEPDKQKAMKLWCDAAVTAITTVKGAAQGTLKVDFVPPKCAASFSAKANCDAKCNGGAVCDIKANPPSCKGGSLSVACKGECKAKAGASLNCTGTCTGSCTGSCTAKGGVECTGKCEGTCTASGAGGTGTGIQADGTCKGTCSGTCAVVAPSVTCNGSCSGSCSASCTGTASASVQCDGDCAAAYEPLKCEGGTLEGGCKVEAKCSANCDASVSAKAECSPPSVAITFSGAANFEAAAKLQATLEANLGVVLAFKARLEGMGKLTATLTGNVGAVADIKASCIPALLVAVNDAVANVGASASAAGSIATSVP